MKPKKITTSPMRQYTPQPPTIVPTALIAQLQAVLTTADQIRYALEVGSLNPAEVERLEALEPRILNTCHELLAQQLTRTRP